MIVEIGRIFFWIGLFCEIIIFLLDRADWYNPYQSMMFRVTFVFFVIKCACTKYKPKEWIFIILCAAFCLLAYSISIKDEIIRAMVFIIAMKDIDVKRTLKLNYHVTLVGVVLLGLLSIFGIMGSVVSPFGYAGKSDILMFSFGLGSSNTFAIQIWLLVALAVYVYHDRLNYISYALLLGLGACVYLLTHCRIALMMICFTVIADFMFKRFPALKTKLWVYVCGIIVTLMCVAFSVYAAAISGWWTEQTPIQVLLNKLTTGRIMSIYPFENGGGVLSNWRLFSAPDFDRYFDMGIVRLFWWYGIIPGSLAILAIIILYLYQYKKGDHKGFIMTLSVVMFTVLEAHFISPFIARAYVLFLMGGAWYRILALTNKENTDTQRHIAFYIGSLNRGGAERVFVNLASYFLSIGYKVTMITQYIREDEYELPTGADRVVSDLSPEECKGRVYNFFARIIKLHRVIRQTDADLLMTTIGKANFMAITCAAFVKTRVVVSVVADPPLEYPTFAMKFLFNTLFGEADGIIMQTDDQRNHLRPGLRNEAVIMPNSVSPAFVKDHFEGTRNKNIYMVGRMDDNKNQAMAISSFAKASDPADGYKLILAGDGPDREKLEALTDELGVKDRVEFTGVVSDIPDRLYDCAAFMLTSDTEGMPNTLLEAMSLGVPCISTDCPCGGPKQIIKDGVNGLLIPVRDEDALSSAMKKIMKDPSFAGKLGDAAYESMKEYRPDAVNLKWKNYFDQVILKA